MNAMIVRRVLVALLSALALSAPAAAAGSGDETNRHLWEPRTTSVAVFKQDMGFFMRAGEVVLRDGWCLADRVPPATFGTLAIYSHKADEVVDIVGSGPGEIVEFDGKDAPGDEASKRARLDSSTNLNVQLWYKQHDTERTAAGKLVSVGPDYVVLAGAGNDFAVPVAGISKMQVLDLPVRVHVRRDDGAPPQTTTLGMAYLRKGITWIPEYTLNVLDDETAVLTLRGTLVNEAEDLVHCDVHFVVGVPHFVHTDYMAPIAVGQIIRTIGASIAPSQVQTQIMSRAALVQNAVMSPQFDVVEQPADARAGDLRSVLGNLPQMEGPAGADYTVYTMKDMTVRRGEKAIVTLFVKKIRYSHTYQWIPPGSMEHFLVLHNATDTAWTTGPCLAVSDERPLSEDLLRYTPKDGDCLFGVTTAVNIAHETSEAEVDRLLKAHSPSNDYFLDLVTLEGTVKLRNFEQRDVEIAIVINVAGKPLSASDEGALSADTTNLKLQERTGSVRWRITLKPGQLKTLTYRYERYVPSR